MPLRSVFLTILLSLVLIKPSFANAVYWDVKELVESNADKIVLASKNSGGEEHTYGSIKTQKLSGLLRIKQRVSAAADTAVDLYLVTGKEPNAFASRHNGRTYFAINLPMLNIVGEDADAIATLMGHEIAHLTQRHLDKIVEIEQNTMIASALLAIISSGFIAYHGMGNYDTGQAVGKIAKGIGKAVYFSYSRDQEREADDIGMDYMAKAGFNPYGGVRLWQIFIADKGVGEFSLKNTHPLSDERLNAMREKIISSYAAFSNKEHDMEPISAPQIGKLINNTYVAYALDAPRVKDGLERKPSQYALIECKIGNNSIRVPRIQCIRDGGELIKRPTGE